MLPGADAAGAQTVGERIRSGLAGHRFDFGGGLHVTCSIGVASFPADGRTRAALVQAADEAMYEAKARGGNQVVAASERHTGSTRARSTRPAGRRCARIPSSPRR